jgi:hypothetical protein
MQRDQGHKQGRTDIDGLIDDDYLSKKRVHCQARTWFQDGRFETKISFVADPLAFMHDHPSSHVGVHWFLAASVDRLVG